MSSLDPMPKVCIAGSQGLFLDAASAGFSEPVQQRVLATASLMSQLPGVREVVPGMNNLLVVYSPADTSVAELTQQLFHAWSHVTVDEQVGREIDVPVIYGGQQGQDLAIIAELAKIDVQTFVQLHSEAVYQVACVGAMPGFPYLSGLNPKLATPRRSVPRMRLEEGSIIIGGAQAGIMPCSAPSGWHVIGRTELKLFNQQRESPSFLQPGDRVRFSIAGIES
ncbi:5-oxoprolinase subunit PxpB [Pseudomonas brassicacearum]|uniref:5-oxoprolinase subunit PxpB n=1 Tax=Pseudomonas brassicacearum TaxID=930166 RepID=UPI0021825273|nr:5-oxoprolinase subunit PxpB [Pseudomonas brassicacearum]